MQTPGKQSENRLSFICRLEFYVRRIVSVVGLIPHIPGQDAEIVRKNSDHALDVGPEARILAGIGEDRSSRRLHAARVVNSGNERMLRAELWIRVTAGIEEYEDGPDVMLGGNGQKLIDAVLKACGILLPNEVVQEDAHGVHAQALCPPELAIDLRRIEGRCLPHFKFVDGVGVKEVCAHKPRLLLVPLIGPVLGPTLRLALQRTAKKKRTPQMKKAPGMHASLRSEFMFTMNESLPASFQQKILCSYSALLTPQLCINRSGSPGRL
jgi:hypothetical protein